tara:strand:+ start:248 stop:1489 length:1242 start_codon:yes stop_codon:yes gene_type:complete
MRYIILIFLFIYAPVIRPVGNWLDLSFFLSLFILIYNNSKILKKIIYPKFFKILLLLFLVSIYSLFLIVDYDSYKINEFIFVVFKPFKVIVTALAGFYLVKSIMKKGIDYGGYILLKYIYTAIFIHGLIMILQFIYPNFKDSIYLITTDFNFRSSFDYNFRMGGLSGGSGGAVLSVVQALGIIIYPFLKNNRNKLFNIITLIVILISVFLSGRSGLWVILIFFPISLILSENTFLKFFKRRFLTLMFFSIGFFFLIQFLRNNILDSEFFNPLFRTLDTFIYYDIDIGFEDRTVNELITNIIFPSDLKILIFGSGEALFNTQFSRTLDSDIGYIRDLWSYGIIFATLYWFPIYYYLISAFKIKCRMKLNNLVIILSLIMIVFHAKENFLYVRMFWPIYALILSYMYLKKDLKTS